MTCPECGSNNVEYTYGDIVSCLECGYTDESYCFKIREQKKQKRNKTYSELKKEHNGED